MSRKHDIKAITCTAAETPYVHAAYFRELGNLGVVNMKKRIKIWNRIVMELRRNGQNPQD
jgi:hypothetical protein